MYSIVITAPDVGIMKFLRCRAFTDCFKGLFAAKEVFAFESWAHFQRAALAESTD